MGAFTLERLTLIMGLRDGRCYWPSISLALLVRYGRGFMDRSPETFLYPERSDPALADCFSTPTECSGCYGSFLAMFAPLTDGRRFDELGMDTISIVPNDRVTYTSVESRSNFICAGSTVRRLVYN